MSSEDTGSETNWMNVSFDFKFLRVDDPELPDYDYRSVLRGMGRAIAYLLYADKLDTGDVPEVGILVRNLQLAEIPFVSDEEIQAMLDSFNTDEDP
jgi:hypothetical protein